MWFVGRKASLRRVPKREQTEGLYRELTLAMDGLIAMQTAVDMGLECLQQLAAEMEERPDLAR